MCIDYAGTWKRSDSELVVTKLVIKDEAGYRSLFDPALRALQRPAVPVSYDRTTTSIADLSRGEVVRYEIGQTKVAEMPGLYCYEVSPEEVERLVGYFRQSFDNMSVTALYCVIPIGALYIRGWCSFLANDVRRVSNCIATTRLLVVRELNMWE